VKIGCSEITWRRQARLEEVLGVIAELGYAGATASRRASATSRA
jgi:hypothetical protein